MRFAGILLACTRVENPAPRSQEGPQREMHTFGHFFTFSPLLEGERWEGGALQPGRGAHRGGPRGGDARGVPAGGQGRAGGAGRAARRGRAAQAARRGEGARSVHRLRGERREGAPRPLEGSVRFWYVLVITCVTQSKKVFFWHFESRALDAFKHSDRPTTVLGAIFSEPRDV